MARNRGKRPGAASGSSSPSQGQAGDVKAKAGDASAGSDRSATGQSEKKTPAAASPALAAKIDPPPATSSTQAASAGKSSGEVSKTGSSAATTATTRPAATTSPSAGASSGAQPGRPATTSSAAASGGTAASVSGGRHGPGSSDGGSGSFWPGLIGGLIGGAATALAASLFWMDSDDNATTAFESRLTAAEQQVGQIDGLSDRLAAVETAPAGNADGGDMAQRLGDLETGLAELSGAFSGGEQGDGAADRLGERMTSLEQQLETVAGLEQKIEALTGEVQAAGEARAANLQALTGLENALPILEETLTATGVAVDQAGEQMSQLNQTVETLNGDVETLAARMGEVESRLDHLGGEYQRGAAMIVAIGDITRSVARAEPFDGSLQTLKSLVRDDAVLGETLSTLEPMAAEGVPTLSELKSGFGQMASRVLLAEEGDQSLTDQVSNNVFGIFQMRPAGADVEGSGSRAVLARAQSKLSADDLDGAILELAGLEGTAADEASAWIERAGARLAAEAAVADLRSHAQGLVAKGT